MKELEKNIINLYGEQGKKWLTSLSEVTARIATAHYRHNDSSSYEEPKASGCSCSAASLKS